MTRARGRDADAAHAPRRARPPRRAHRPAPHAARQPAHRRRPDPARAQAPPRTVRRRIVLLCDISGSMEPYARAYLQFLDVRAAGDAEAFVFATRLTRITRALATRNPERAIQRAAAAAPDWSSGTRIGDALQRVQRPPRPARDGARRGDRDPLRRLGARRARARRRARWSGWRGSRTGSCGSTRASGAAGFAPRVGGMAAALPHVDALVSGHSLEALREVDRRDRRRARRRSRRRRRSPRRRSHGRAPHPSAGELGGDAQWLRPEPRKDDARMEPMNDLHLPGLRPPGGAAAPARRPAAGVLRPRGPQRADRAPGARAPARGGEQAWLTRPIARCSCASTRPARWCSASRPRPTATSARYAQLVADELGVPRARRQGRARRREPLRLRPRLQHERRPAARRRRSPAPRGKIRAKARLLAGAALERRTSLEWDNGAFVGDGESRTIADLALYAHGTGALPPGVEGGLDAQTVYRD